MDTTTESNCNCGESQVDSVSTVFSSSNIKKKLGKCKKCILIASLGTFVSWLLYIVAISNPILPIVYKYGVFGFYYINVSSDTGHTTKK